jgi:hypothetical protein
MSTLDSPAEAQTSSGCETEAYLTILNYVRWTDISTQSLKIDFEYIDFDVQILQNNVQLGNNS